MSSDRNAAVTAQSPESLNRLSPRLFLGTLLDAAIAAAQPEQAVIDRLPLPPKGRTVVVVGAGKASAAMAAAVDKVWEGSLEGLVVTRYGFGCSAGRIEIAEAAHPVPDLAGPMAARRMLSMLASLGPEGHVIALVSGGGSALLALPPDGVSFEALCGLYTALLRSGADITAMNTVRKHFSMALGGRLAAACPQMPMTTLAVSDVPGDDGRGHRWH